MYVNFGGIEGPSCLVSLIVHSFVEVTCGADVLANVCIVFVCALGQRCLDGICICGPRNWTFFGTPLFFCLILLSVPGSDRICAEDLGAAVGPPWLVTEAPDHQQTVDISLQILVG